MNLLILLLLFLIFYTYFGYTAVVIVLSKFINKRIVKKDITPSVALMIAAYNEEAGIEEKIRNSLELDYPEGKLRIIVVSDASSDETENIVKSYSSKGVELIRVEGRVGKTEARNQAVKMVQEEIIVFSDGTTHYEKDSIQKLVRNFADFEVGMVTGHLIYKDDANTQVGTGQKLYWKYETLIKQAQTRLGTLTGSIGCITAFRTKSYTALPPNIIEDFTGPLFMIQKGMRVVYEAEAICYEETTRKPKNEWSMRIRVIRGGMTGMLYAKKVLNPFKYPAASFQLISHKVLRWLIPVLGILLFVISLCAVSLIPQNYFAQIILGLQVLFYLMSLLGLILDKFGKANKLLGIPLYFVILNAASLVALFKVLTTELESTWETQRD